jgi:hypothetical protein
MGRKTIYTLNINNYAPQITKLTYPLLKYYARKIGADFYVIKDRKFPEWGVTYEKLQIFELAEQRGDEWSIYIDSDALVHPETLDWTVYLSKDTIAHNGTDFANVRWRYDRYFQRDGRNIGSCNWLTIASEWCRDLWHPLEISPKEAVDAIFPTVMEMNTVITPDHLIDDYALSRNIARYGLKTKTLLRLGEEVIPGSNFYWHAYVLPIEQKVMGFDRIIPETGAMEHVPGMIDIINSWKVERYVYADPLTIA